MNDMVPWIWAAGVAHILIAAGNAFVPGRLNYREHLPKLPPMLRQIYIVHSIYLVLVLLIFAALCLLFAPELAGGSPLGRFLSGAMCLFWAIRVPLQLFYYDPEMRRRHRLLDVVYIMAVAALAVIFGAAFWAGGQ